MIAAIYARKSTDQNITGEEKSVTRELAQPHARHHGERCRGPQREPEGLR